MTQLQLSSPASLFAAHIGDFRSPASAVAWRRRASKKLERSREAVFAKALTPIGSAASDGFGAGRPDLRRQILLTVWRSNRAFAGFREHPLSRELLEGERASVVLGEVASTRGSHFGARPLTPAVSSSSEGAVAVLTLGRCSWRRLPAFLREGARLAPFLRDARGLIAAASAGNPRTGNCTLSVWESEDDMLEFSYRQREGHRATVDKKPPILTEQLNARIRIIDVAGQWAHRIRPARRSLKDEV